jgi:O-antigen/teichoic acid export membrane protein
LLSTLLSFLSLTRHSGRVRPLSLNLAANATTTAIMAGFQIISVPVFLNYWGAPLYGEWLALNSLSAYIQASDAGLNSATANELSYHYSRAEHTRCVTLLNNNLFFVCSTFTVMLLAFLISAWAGVFAAVFRFSNMEPATINVCLLLLFVHVFFGTLGNLLNGIYRATDRYARGITFDNATRLADNAVILAAVATNFSVTKVLALSVLTKAAGVAVKYADARRIFSWPLGTRYLNRRELRRMMAPALSFFSLPVSNAVAFQGPILAVSYFFGGSAVTVVSTMRTLANLPKSVIDIIHRSVWPELSLAYGRADVAALRALHRQTVLVSVAVAAAAGLVLLFAGPAIYKVWTRGEVQFEPMLLRLFLISLILNALWTANSVVLQATNSHAAFSMALLGGSALALIVTLVLLSAGFPFTWVALGQVALDLALAAFIARSAATTVSGHRAVGA